MSTEQQLNIELIIKKLERKIKNRMNVGDHAKASELYREKELLIENLKMIKDRTHGIKN